MGVFEARSGTTPRARWILPLVLLAGCGDDPPTVATPQTTPTPCTRTVVYERPGRVPANVLVFAGFVTREEGRIDATVDWTFPATPMTVSLADHAPCRIDEPLERCGVLAGSATGPKPRTVSIARAPAGSYWLYISNRGTQDDSASAQVVLSTTGCP
jgi:hypothetical protein